MRITAISAKTMTPAVLRRRLSVSRALPAGTPCGFPLSSQDEDNFPRFEFDISAGDFLQDLRLGGGDVNGPLPPALSPIDTSLSYSADTLDALQASAAAVAPHSLSHAPPVDMREGGDQGLQREGGAQEASEVENPARGGEEFSEGMSQEVSGAKLEIDVLARSRRASNHASMHIPLLFSPTEILNRSNCPPK